MSAQEHWVTCLNRFILLFQQQAKACLEITCNDSKLHIKITHDIGEVYETSIKSSKFILRCIEEEYETVTIE